MFELIPFDRHLSRVSAFDPFRDFEELERRFFGNTGSGINAFRTDVIEAMKEQLCKDWDAKDWTDLQEETGIGALGELYLTNNFLLKNDSIEFLFNQYEIAPYAAGLIGVTVKWP